MQGTPRRTTLTARELVRYKIDIDALSESILPEKGFLVEMGTGHTFFRNGFANDTRQIFGVGFAVWTVFFQRTQESLCAIDVPLMSLRLPFANNGFATFVSVHSPALDSSDDVKVSFHDPLYSTFRMISRND